MANLYGVANAPGMPIWVNFTSGAVINCPANTQTIIWTTPNLVAPSAGYFYAMVMYGMEVTFGATVPTGMNGYVGIGAGTAVNNISIPGSAFIANGTIFFYLTNITPASQTAWQGAGSPVNVYLNPGTQAVSVQAFSSGLVVLFRAPDQ